jgi:hypothetical protein
MLCPFPIAPLAEVYCGHCHLATPKHNPRCIHCGQHAPQYQLPPQLQNSVRRKLVERCRPR